MHLKTGRYKNGYELYSCICGSVVQSRNLCNHFNTNKHKKFLFNSTELLDEYSNITRCETKLKILSHQKKRMIQRLQFPIVLSFD